MPSDTMAQVGGIAALLATGTLVVGATALTPGRGRLRPWLLVLVQVNARRRGVSHSALHGVALVDIFLLACAATTYAGFWPTLGTPHGWAMRAGLGLAVAQPALGILLLLLTRQAGRSGLMGGGLVLSILLLADGTWTGAGWLGAVACTLLLVGDVASTPRRHSPALAAVLALGYAALIGWFGWAAALLLVLR